MKMQIKIYANNQIGNVLNVYIRISRWAEYAFFSQRKKQKIS